jgi:hypothetical protein
VGYNAMLACFPPSFLPVCIMLVSSLDYSSTVKMEAICSSKDSVDFKQTAWHYIPDDKLFMTTAVRTSNPIQLLYCSVELPVFVFQ